MLMLDVVWRCDTVEWKQPNVFALYMNFGSFLYYRKFLIFFFLY